MRQESKDHSLMAGHLAASILMVAFVLVVFAGSIGAVVLVWRWMMQILFGGCA